MRRGLKLIEVVTACDKLHYSELCFSIRTHRLFKPDLLKQPWLIFYDESQVHVGWLELLGLPKARFIPWSVDYECSQRAKMLSAFVLGVAKHCQQSWYYKLDCDTISTSRAPWFKPEWMEGNPAWCGQKWGYTKPRSMLDELDKWADTVPELRDLPAPAREIRGDVAKHRRLISWAMLGNTEWLRKIVSWMDGRMPCDSQDTTISYVSSRLGSPVKYVDMKACGLSHVGRGGARLEQAVAEVLA